MAPFVAANEMTSAFGKERAILQGFDRDSFCFALLKFEKSFI